MRNRMRICGEDFNIEKCEGGGLTAISVRDSMFFFSGKDYADLRRRMPAEREAWQAERMKAAALTKQEFSEEALWMCTQRILDKCGTEAAIKTIRNYHATRGR